MSQLTGFSHSNPSRRGLRRTVVLLLVMAFSCFHGSAYSVLSHEETVDLAWKSDILPLLRERYPDATPQQLQLAHSYAYGGAIIQDLGYYPFGSHDVSDLLHYVRTGAFIDNVLAEAHDLNEYAFALGALAHYRGDTTGHPAVGLATAREYPQLRSRFGKFVSYYDSPKAHIRTEFGFDVVQVAQGHYVKDNYANFIGFNVAMPLLKRAFQDTYGIDLHTALKHEDLAVSTYRYSVSTAIPEMTRVAVLHYSKEIQKKVPSYNRRTFVYKVERAQYQQEYGKQYHRPGPGAYVIDFIIRIMPKIGPFSVFRLQLPSAEDQKLYLDSMQTTAQRYDGDLRRLRAERGRVQKLGLPDLDYDTGKPTHLGEYPLADRSYARLLAKVTRQPNTAVSPDLRASLLDYYSTLHIPKQRRAAVLLHFRKDRRLRRVQLDLAKLRSEPTAPVNSRTETQRRSVNPAQAAIVAASASPHYAVN